MSTTLTNGLKLPDKGSVDWYADMQSNYAILDGAVGTIAEHTAALAGKAPAVHTHTKSDITDFPAYGNAAGTICEGNDSRLSDARTPVAHTHTKSDITNLFNSANTWSDHNTYTKYIYMQNSSIEIGNAPSSNTSKEITFTDKNNATLSRVLSKTGSNGESYIALHACNKYLNGAIDPNGTNVDSFFYVGIDATGNAYNVHKANTYPETNNSYDLGISGKQWNNIYAKNYFYNGTAWGLDKENVWSDSNRFTKSIGLGYITSYTDCSLGFTGLYNVLFFNTRGSTNITSYGTYVYYGYSNASSDRGGVIRMVRTTDKRGDTNDGYIPDLSFNLYKISPAKLFIDFMEAVRVTNDGTENSLKPITNNATDLGTSTNKWKSFNGINPGALSLPDYNNYLDVTSSIPVASLDGNTQIDLNEYLPSKTGWLSIVIADTAGNSILVVQGRSSGSTFISSRSFHSGSQSGGYISVFMPIIADLSKPAFIKASSLIQMRFYYCLGNV